MTKEPARRKRAASAALDQAQVEAIVAGQHGDPFSVLGMQGPATRPLARAFVDGAAELEAFSLGGESLGVL